MKHTVYIHARIGPYEWNKDEIEYWVGSLHVTGNGWVCVGSREVDIPEITRADLVPDAIKAMQAEQQQIRADAEVKAQKLQAQIDKLLAIEVTA